MRWPKSASKTAASASRRPVRRPRCPISPRRHRRRPSRAPSSRPSSRSIVAPTAVRTWAASGSSAWPGRATMRRRTRTRSSWTATRTAGPREPAAPRRAAAADARDAGDLERGQADELGDDAVPTVSSGPAVTGDLLGLGRSRRRRRGRRPSRPSLRAAIARSRQRIGDELRHACPRRRRRHLARRSRSSVGGPVPWVMMTVPLTPSSGEPPTFS